MTKEEIQNKLAIYAAMTDEEQQSHCEEIAELIEKLADAATPSEQISDNSINSITHWRSKMKRRIRYHFYRVCPYCGANLDPGEHCDCGGKE